MPGTEPFLSGNAMQCPDFMVNGRVVVVLSSLPASQCVFMESHKTQVAGQGIFI